MSKDRILVVDDHVEMGKLLGDQLGDAGYLVEVATNGEDAIARLAIDAFDAVVTDLRMEGRDGFDVLAAAHAVDPHVPVLIMTAFGAIESAIEAMRRGAYHYLAKPFRSDELLLHLERGLAERRLRDENRALRKVATERSGFGAMLGRSREMQQLFDLLGRVAEASAPVLLRAESGTGKELVARALHFEGPRKARAFVAVNCTALPEALLESELFGHVRGSFTGATAPRRGLFVEADGGTLFLDEIGDMAPALQAKLLRALEEGEIRAVGSDTPRKVDVRVIAATHQDLEARVRSGAFRADLFYRLNVVPVTVPPLRRRVEDIPMLVEHFLAKARARNPSSPVRGFSADAIAQLARRPWPGNVRELENVVERLVIVGAQPTLSASDLLALLGENIDPIAAESTPFVTLKQVERDHIARVLREVGGNKTRAAEILGIDVSTIHRKERDQKG
ncbi:MAG: sigma-54 dependent transcriptional regulator [Polyangia bacterium]